MSSGDYFRFTTLSCSGIDIASMWENSKSITPPQHILFLNPVSIKSMLESCGFEVLEVTTPGKLDLDILFNNQEAIKDRFVSQAITTLTETQRTDLQLALSQNGLSSHMMVTCLKK
jgi:hypothetical protein